MVGAVRWGVFVGLRNPFVLWAGFVVWALVGYDWCNVVPLPLCFFTSLWSVFWVVFVLSVFVLVFLVLGSQPIDYTVWTCDARVLIYVAW